MTTKSHKAVCGADITEAHYWRNVARELVQTQANISVSVARKLAKRKHLTEAQKVEYVQQALDKLALLKAACESTADALQRSLAARTGADTLAFEVAGADPHEVTPDVMAKALMQQRLTLLAAPVSL